MGTKWWCLILTCFFQALGLSLACALSMDSLQDSKVGNSPESCVQYSMMSVLSIFLYLWWGITGLPLLCGAFLKITTFFQFLKQNHPVFQAVTLQHGIAEWLRWERPYEDHLVLPPHVFSFEAQCRCSKSTEKWGCRTVMIAAYLTTPPVFPVG